MASDKDWLERVRKLLQDLVRELSVMIHDLKVEIDKRSKDE